jgi:hypothetical protein
VYHPNAISVVTTLAPNTSLKRQLTMNSERKSASGVKPITVSMLKESGVFTELCGVGGNEMEIAKDDKGKAKLSLVPVQIIRDIASVREYGTEKYHDPDNWRKVELQRYIDAFYRHWLAFLEDNHSKDAESGIEHYKHMACNMAFICELMKEGKQ